MNQTLSIEIDFEGVKNKEDIIKRLVSTLELPDFEGSKWNWDSFEDYFTNLDSDSNLIRESGNQIKKVSLTVKNVQETKKVSQKDYGILLSVLDHATKIENRGDKIEFSYRIA